MARFFTFVATNNAIIIKCWLGSQPNVSYANSLASTSINSDYKASNDMSVKSTEGSDFARMLLEHGFKDRLCCVSNDSEFRAIWDQEFVVRISAYKDNQFIDINGQAWLFAVPIKIERLTEQDL